MKPKIHSKYFPAASPSRHRSGWIAIAILAATVTQVLTPAAAIGQETSPGYKSLPPAGIELDVPQRKELENRVQAARASLAAAVIESPDAVAWQSDIDVLIRAVHLALTQNLFFKKNQVKDANRLLDEVDRRLKAVAAGERGLSLLGFSLEKNDAPQTLAGGFVSRIDDSVQPFGIVVPAGYDPKKDVDHRMDVWLHGRGDTKTEIPFLTERMSKIGYYAPKNTFVLHPFGRHCNAFKFAGETDVYEAMEHAESLFQVDQDRVSIRGFSMGGAGCWHLAVHQPTRWMAANPGAGFVDTLVYQGWNSDPPFDLTPTAKKLLNWYDVLPWTQNLTSTNTIPYSGEVDKQKQAADRVVARASQMGIEIPYVVGAGMGHKVDDASKKVIEQKIAAWAKDATAGPRQEIDFLTYTLRYSTADWLRITGMKEHWTPAGIKATLGNDESVTIVTNNVTHLELDFSASGWPEGKKTINLEIDGQSYTIEDSGNRRGFQSDLAKDTDGQWTQRERDDEELRKRPGLQGPIDDAFCDRFVIVLPSRPARHGRVQRWIDRETAYLKSRWQRLMRGNVQVVLDRDLTDDQIETCNLICFGDYSSNRLLFNVSHLLPIQWTRETLTVGAKNYDPVKHVPVFCYPNPMNPKRYIVVNSGMTFREFSNVSNSRQIAMLPDWAILDVSSKDDSIYAGEIQAQGFFDESWRLTTEPGDE